MLDIWLNSSNFNHCLLIAPASIFLVWRRRQRLAVIAPRPSLVGVGLFACLAILWVFGALGHIVTLQNFAAVAMISACLWAVLGYGVVREIAFPLAYLLFMVPFGEFLIPWLMGMTAELTVMAARLSGVAVYQDGLYFTIPNGSFQIIEACSGICMLIASIAVGVLFAHLAFVSRWRRAGFLAAMIVVSLIANSIRAYIVVMVAHYIGMEAVTDHVMLGYVIFGAVLVVMLLIGSRFSDVDQAESDASPVAWSGGGAPVWPSALAAITVSALAFAGPTAASRIEADIAGRPPAPPMVLPPAAAAWSGPGVARTDWSPQFLGPDTRQSGVYEKDGKLVDVWILSYSSQAQGAEVINAQNRVFDPGHWTPLRDAGGTQSGPGSAQLDYRELELLSARGEKRVVRFWYVIGGQPSINPLWIKLQEIGNSMTGQPTAASVVAVSTRLGSGDAGQVLDEFIEEVYSPAYMFNGGIDPR